MFSSTFQGSESLRVFKTLRYFVKVQVLDDNIPVGEDGELHGCCGCENCQVKMKHYTFIKQTTLFLGLYNGTGA